VTKELYNHEFPTQGKLRINDLMFDIPPESIGITITEYDKSTFLLSEAIPSTLKTGRKRIIVSLPIIFDLKELGYLQIAKLLIQVRKSPIATIENEKLRLEILGPNSNLSTNIAMIIENITCSIDREFPTLLRCNVQMSWFNHLAYVPNVCYKGNTSKGETTINNTPQSLYKEFYEYDTMIKGKLINDPSLNSDLSEDVLDIF